MLFSKPACRLSHRGGGVVSLADPFFPLERLMVEEKKAPLPVARLHPYLFLNPQSKKKSQSPNH